MKNQPIHIVFSGGGTGGHLFPGLAVAERLAAMLPRARITFCGGGKPFELQAVAAAGFEYFALPVRPMPHGPREAVSFIVENMAGYLAAGRFAREENVGAVVGLGGYASVPMARAAIRRKLPLVLLEQNAVPGRANRWLARGASLICSSFDLSANDFNGRCPVRVTGNPIRSGFVGKEGLEIRDGGLGEDGRGKAKGGLPCMLSLSTLHSPLSTFSPLATSHWPLATNSLAASSNLLVLGGSGGAAALNENVPKALYKIRRQLDGWRVVHQSGQSGFDAAESLYRKFDLPATVVPFIDDMPGVLRATDLAVCRAGGTTLAELAATGMPAVLLPYPHAADDHQLANARHFSAGGGCVTIDQREISDRLDDRLADILCFLLANGVLRRRMSSSIARLAQPSAAQEVAELIWSVVSSRARQQDLLPAG